MRLEDEIKQTKPISPFEKGVINLILTDNYISSKLKSFLQEYDLTIQQYNVLRILRGQYPEACTNNLIKDRMLFKNADTSRLIDRLVDKSFVDRKQSEEDRRQVDILISDQGLELLQEIDQNVGRIESLLDNLNKTEVKQLNRLLDKIRD
jgi:DNA-binding MarR family transcriptional regulator